VGERGAARVVAHSPLWYAVQKQWLLPQYSCPSD